MMGTVVIFRKWKRNGDVIAIFPYEICDTNGNCSSYEHIGQHGPANYGLVEAYTTPASEKEYEDLKRELQSIGYSLEIKKRRSHSRWSKAFEKFRKIAV